MTRHHPANELLVEYAAGSLSNSLSLCIHVHLKYCAHCEETVRRLEVVGAALLDTIDTVPVSMGSFDTLMARIDSMEESPQATVQTGADRARQVLSQWLPGGWGVVGWKPQWFKLYEYVLSLSENGRERLSLIRINAGGSAPQHSHHGREITVVLEGGFSDDQGVYETGDFVIRDAGHCHQPRAHENGDCICLSLLDAPIRLTGPIGQWIERLRHFFAPLPE